jgi:predicted lipoprotein with Yx(FWY)xxD motif
MNSFTNRAIVTIAAGTLVLAACGGDDAADAPVTEPSAAPTSAAQSTAAPETTEAAATTTPAATTAPDPAASPATTEAMVDGAVIELAEGDLGQVIVAADGLTLYLFDPDVDGVPTCSGGCAGTWPPYYVDEGAALTAGDGLDAALLGTVEHPDGGTMLKYGDWPLYYFANDQAPGDTNGQGVNDVWWVVDATGEAVRN